MTGYLTRLEAGDFVLGDPESPIAVCTLATRTLLPKLAGRPEIAIAGRVFTENVGVERMVRNLLAMPGLSALILCGRESRHRVGETILCLHRDGLDGAGRVVGSQAPEPFMPNLGRTDLRRFQDRFSVIDLVGELSVDAILARARACLGERPRPGATADRSAVEGPPTELLPAEASAVTRSVERLVASPDPPEAWRYDPSGFFLIFPARDRGILLVEQYDRGRTLLRVIEGRTATELCHTLVRHGLVQELAHAAYLGRELARAEDALRLGLHYEQDSPLQPSRRATG
jgi:tetrahydromethanopterin S-methyltransferase subunit A